MGHTFVKHSLVTCAALALVPLVTASCGDSPTDEGAAATTLSVFLKDAPGDVDRVWLQVEDVVLVGDGGQVSLLSEPSDLLEVTVLTDSAAALVEDHPIDPGTYSEVRLVLSGAVLQAGDNVYSFGDVELPEDLVATGPLQCPSCSQSGIKVKLGNAFTLEDGDNGFLLDFDLTQSFGHQAGQSGKWVMHPVVHGSVADPDDIEDGAGSERIAGTVSLASDVEVPACGGAARTLGDFVPTATAATLTDDEGMALLFTGATMPTDAGFTFRIDVAEPDGYALGYAAETVFETEQLLWTATVEPESVTVSEGDDVIGGVAYTVSAVSCSEVTP